MTQSIEKLLHTLNPLLKNDFRRDTIIDYYRRKPQYLKHIITALKIVKKAKPKSVYSVIKTTRAGASTNILLACLFLDIKITLISPTNNIALEIMKGVLDIYFEITGDKNKFGRNIPSNISGCSYIKAILQGKEDHLAQFRPSDCEKCDIKTFEINDINEGPPMTLGQSTPHKCVIKTMMEEAKLCQSWRVKYAPDIVSITSSKMQFIELENNLNEFFSSIVSSTDAVLFDEFGKYIQSTEVSYPIYQKAENRKGGVEWDESIKDDIEKIEQYIKNTFEANHQKKLLHFIEVFIHPLVKIHDEILKTTMPHTRWNPLALDFRRLENGEVVKKHEYLKYEFKSVVKLLDTIMIDKEGILCAKKLFDLVLILMNEKITVYKIYNGTKWLENGDGKKVEYHINAVKITTPNDHTIKFISRCFPSKKLNFLTDATLPMLDISKKIRRLKFENVMYGDPADTNSNFLVVKYPSKYRMSAKSWFRKEGFADTFEDDLEKIMKELGVGPGEIILVTPNKDVANYFLGDGIDDNPNPYKDITVSANIKNPPPDKMIVTYYNSIISRGVEVNRRIIVLLGVNSMPNHSYLHVVFGLRDLYKYLNKTDIEHYAKKHGLKIRELKGLIRQFIKHDDKITFFPHPAVRDVYEYLADIVQIDITAQNTMQMLSRAKASDGENRGVAICLGFSDDDFYNIINWSGNTTYRGARKFFEVDDYRIPAPLELHTDNMNLIKEFLDNGDIDPDYSGFEKDFSNAIYMALSRKKEPISTKEVWSNMVRNLKIGHGHDDYDNGYLIGIVNIHEKQIKEFYGINIKRSGNQHSSIITFQFDTYYKDKRNIELSNMQNNAIKVLRSAYISKEKRYTFKTAIANMKLDIDKKLITPEEIREAFDFIDRENVLNGSSWTMEDNRKKDESRIIVKVRPE